MKWIGVIIACLGLAAIERHEFYVSITEMNVRNDTLQVAVKLFTDDLEFVLKEENGQAIFLDHGSDQDKVFRQIRNYCTEHLKFSSPTKPYSVEWIGHEFSDDVTWLYGFTVLEKESTILFAQNTLLLKQFPAQQNIMHLSVDQRMSTQVCGSETREARFSVRR